MKKDFNDFTLKDLYNAYYDCRKHKRNTIDSLKFERDLEINMLELYNDLKKGTYKI
jgi:hypothetical protein